MSYDNLKSKIKYLNLIISYNLTQNSEIIIVSFTKQPKVYNLEISFVTQSWVRISTSEHHARIHIVSLRFASVVGTDEVAIETSQIVFRDMTKLEEVSRRDRLKCYA